MRSRLSKTQLTVAAVVLLTCTIAPMSQVKRGRTKAGFDVGPTYDFLYGDGPLVREAKEAGLRSFIWQHWTEKRAGKVTARFYTIEGDPTVHTFYIRRAGDGNWEIVSKVEKYCCWFYFLQKSRRKPIVTTTTETYRSLERVEPTTEPDYRPASSGATPDRNELKIVALDDADSRPADKYRLRFRSAQAAGGDWYL